MQCIGHFKLLLSLLGLEGCVEVQRSVLSLIESVTSNAECVSDIAASEVIIFYLETLVVFITRILHEVNIFIDFFQVLA